MLEALKNFILLILGRQVVGTIYEEKQELWLSVLEQLMKGFNCDSLISEALFEQIAIKERAEGSRTISGLRTSGNVQEWNRLNQQVVGAFKTTIEKHSGSKGHSIFDPFDTYSVQNFPIVDSCGQLIIDRTLLAFAWKAANNSSSETHTFKKSLESAMSECQIETVWEAVLVNLKLELLKLKPEEFLVTNAIDSFHDQVVALLKKIDSTTWLRISSILGGNRGYFLGEIAVNLDVLIKRSVPDFQQVTELVRLMNAAHSGEPTSSANPANVSTAVFSTARLLVQRGVEFLRRTSSSEQSGSSSPEPLEEFRVEPVLLKQDENTIKIQDYITRLDNISCRWLFLYVLWHEITPKVDTLFELRLQLQKTYVRSKSMVSVPTANGEIKIRSLDLSSVKKMSGMGSGRLTRNSVLAMSSQPKAPPDESAPAVVREGQVYTLDGKLGEINEQLLREGLEDISARLDLYKDGLAEAFVALRKLMLLITQLGTKIADTVDANFGLQDLLSRVLDAFSPHEQKFEELYTIYLNSCTEDTVPGPSAATFAL